MSRYCEENDNPAFVLAFTFLIGIIFGVFGWQVALHFTKPEPPPQPQVVNQYLRSDFCMTCHYGRQNPTIKDLKGFKKTHPSPLAQRRLLKELEEGK